MQQRGFDTLHQDMVHDAQFDFYGKRLATCSSDSLVKVWQVDAGDQYTQTGEIAMHEGPVWQVSWSHPQFGSLLATCGYDKRVMVFREASPGNWVRVFCYEGHLSSVNGLSWAPPELGLHLATASSDGKVVVLSHRESDDGWDVAALEDSTLGTLAVSWAPAVGGGAGGARFLATAGCDGSVNVWGCEGGGGGKWSKRGGALKCCPSGEAVWVRDVAWCPMEGVAGGSGEEGVGGNAASAGAGAAGAGATPPLLLAAATDAGVVHLFRTKGGGAPGTLLEWEAPITLPKFNATVWRVSWSATGRLLAVSSGDNTVTLWKEDVSRTWQQVCNAPVNSQ